MLHEQFRLQARFEEGALVGKGVVVSVELGLEHQNDIWIFHVPIRSSTFFMPFFHCQKRITPSTYSSSADFIHLYTVFPHPPTLTPCPLTILKAAHNEASCSQSCSHPIHSAALWLNTFVFCSTSLTASCVSKRLLFLLFPLSFLKKCRSLVWTETGSE